MEGRAGINRLGQMAGVDSIDRNLQREDDAVERDRRRHERELAGEAESGGDDSPLLEEDPMRIMAARDVQITYDQRPPAPPPEVPVAAEVPPAAKKTAGLLAKAAITAALLGTGAGGGVLIPWAMGAFGGADKPDADTQYELRIGPPETPGQ